jgi:hypothetical protein
MRPAAHYVNENALFWTPHRHADHQVRAMLQSPELAHTRRRHPA